MTSNNMRPMERTINLFVALKFIVRANGSYLDEDGILPCAVPHRQIEIFFAASPDISSSSLSMSRCVMRRISQDPSPFSQILSPKA